MAEVMRDAPRSAAVVRLLRCNQTRRYLAPEGWTQDDAQALTFTDEIDAVRACFQRGLNDVDLVIRASGANTDLFCTRIR